MRQLEKDRRQYYPIPVLIGVLLYPRVALARQDWPIGILTLTKENVLDFSTEVAVETTTVSVLKKTA